MTVLIVAIAAAASVAFVWTTAGGSYVLGGVIVFVWIIDFEVVNGMVKPRIVKWMTSDPDRRARLKLAYQLVWIVFAVFFVVTFTSFGTAINIPTFVGMLTTSFALIPIREALDSLTKS